MPERTENQELREKCKNLERERDIAEQAAYPVENDKIEELEAEVKHLKKLVKNNVSNKGNPLEERFTCWAGQGLPKGWSENMETDAGDIVWPITDNKTCGPIEGFPKPNQMLCWCPSSEKQSQVIRILRLGTY